MQIRMCCYITQLRTRLSKEMSPLSKVTHYFRTVAFIIISKTFIYKYTKQVAGAHKFVIHSGVIVWAVSKLLFYGMFII